MSERRRVLITDHPWPDLDIERSILDQVGADVIVPADSTAEAIAAIAPSADAIAVCWAPFPGELLEKCTRCQVIARLGVGLDNIPVATAARLGITVTYVPDYCVAEVADHSLALILALLRNVPAFDRSLKAGHYEPNIFEPRRLRTLTIGLAGFGRIGRAVAERAAAFGMPVLAYSRSGDPHGQPVRMVRIEELLSASDVVSLHLPLSEETQQFINAERLALMKPTSYVVNTSRGGLIDPSALLAALEAGRLAGAGLDVFDPEPPPAHDPLVRHPRVIATPHTAFRSVEALNELRTRAARQIADVLAGKTPENVVRPNV